MEPRGSELPSTAKVTGGFGMRTSDFRGDRRLIHLTKVPSLIFRVTGKRNRLICRSRKLATLTTPNRKKCMRVSICVLRTQSGNGPGLNFFSAAQNISSVNNENQKRRNKGESAQSVFSVQGVKTVQWPWKEL